MNGYSQIFISIKQKQRGSIILAAFGAAGRLHEVITLSGSTGSPNEVSDFATSPADATAGWIFNTDGTVDKNDNGSVTQFQTGVEWSNFQPTPGQDYWIRAANNNGTDPNLGSVLDTWLKIAGAGSSIQFWEWTVTGIGTLLDDSIKVEIATDSGGSDIVATGYYGIDDVTVEP